MCLDEVTYEAPRKDRAVILPPHFEIEVESKGAPRQSVKQLALHLERDLNLKPSPETKYQRGISLLKEQGCCRERGFSPHAASTLRRLNKSNVNWCILLEPKDAMTG